mgnify:CR=1 FL=1
MELTAPCKINLGLRITARRPDGYHEIETVMLPLPGLADRLTVTKRPEGIRFENRGFSVDCPPERNLCVRAARLLQQRFGIGGLEICLDKRVPFGAGLGGGSSDAATVLRVANELYGLGLPFGTLESLAAELGSDTPFFIRNTPRLCSGRGERMEPIDIDLKGLHIVVVKPPETISTAEAYAGVRPDPNGTPLRDILASAPGCWRDRLSNAFEATLFTRMPRLAELKESLYRAGAIYASLSGSGSALYGIFEQTPHYATDDPTLFLHTETLC